MPLILFRVSTDPRQVSSVTLVNMNQSMPFSKDVKSVTGAAPDSQYLIQ